MRCFLAICSSFDSRSQSQCDSRYSTRRSMRMLRLKQQRRPRHTRRRRKRVDSAYVIRCSLERNFSGARTRCISTSLRARMTSEKEARPGQAFSIHANAARHRASPLQPHGGNGTILGTSGLHIRGADIAAQ
eukprot:IDg15338t1